MTLEELKKKRADLDDCDDGDNERYLGTQVTLLEAKLEAIRGTLPNLSRGGLERDFNIQEILDV